MNWKEQARGNTRKLCGSGVRKERAGEDGKVIEYTTSVWLYRYLITISIVNFR